MEGFVQRGGVVHRENRTVDADITAYVHHAASHQAGNAHSGVVAEGVADVDIKVGRQYGGVVGHAVVKHRRTGEIQRIEFPEEIRIGRRTGDHRTVKRTVFKADIVRAVTGHINIDHAIKRAIFEQGVAAGGYFYTVIYFRFIDLAIQQNTVGVKRFGIPAGTCLLYTSDAADE